MYLTGLLLSDCISGVYFSVSSCSRVFDFDSPLYPCEFILLHDSSNSPLPSSDSLINKHYLTTTENETLLITSPSPPGSPPLPAVLIVDYLLSLLHSFPSHTPISKARLLGEQHVFPLSGLTQVICYFGS